MSTFYVKKDGSGTHTTIQSAFVQAVSGDIIEVEAGLFEENVDFYKSGITLKGAGKNLTEIRGVLESNVTKACTFTSGSTTLNIAAGTAGWIVGRYIQGTGLAAGTRIVSVSSTSVTISIATTSARTNQSVVMTAVPSTVVVRGANHKIKDLKITAVQALESRCTADNAAIFFRNTGNGEVPANGYILEDCIIEARGESAIMTDAAATIGNGIIRNNIVQGKTFVGASAAQVPAFGTMTKTGTVLSARTIQFNDLSGITAPHAGNSQGSEITPGLRVSAINGNIVTVTANIPDAVGTSRSFSFANVQFNFPNVPRQLVVVQGVNSATQFLNNTINGVTGSGITYNTAVTVDAPSSTITGNTINGQFKYGYALRARGANSTVSGNINYSFPGNENAGYLIGPTGSQVSGMTVGTNTSITAELVSVEQTAGESFVSFEMSKEVLKQNSAVSSHPVFSNEANWNMVSYVFKHDSSARRLVGSFKDFSSPKKSKLKPNMAIGDTFELHKIILATSPRDLLVLKRSQISGASGFDFNLVSDGPEEVLPSSNQLYFENITSGIMRNGNGLAFPASGTEKAVDINSLGSGAADFDVTFNILNINGILDFSNPLKMGMSQSTSYDFPPYEHWYVKLQKGTEFYTIAYIKVNGGQQIISQGIIPISLNSFAFRMVQSSGSLSFYNGTELLGTYTAPVLTNYYPFVESNNVDCDILVTKVAAPALNYVQWVNPAPNVYNIEADGGLTNGSSRGSDEERRIYGNTLVGDFEIIFNIGSICDYDTIFGVTTVTPPGGGAFNTFTGVAGWYPGVSDGKILINNSHTSTFIGPMANKQFKMTRVGNTISCFSNGVLVHTQVAVLGEVKITASLNSTSWGNGAVLVDSSFSE